MKKLQQKLFALMSKRWQQKPSQRKTADDGLSLQDFMPKNTNSNPEHDLPVTIAADARTVAENKANAAGMKMRKSQHKEHDETGGPQGLEPTRYGDWERAGRCIDF